MNESVSSIPSVCGPEAAGAIGHAAYDATPSFEELRGRCMANGVLLMRSKDATGAECFVVSRWNLMRDLPTLEAVGQWLEKVGGRR